MNYWGILDNPFPHIQQSETYEGIDIRYDDSERMVGLHRGMRVWLEPSGSGLDWYLRNAIGDVKQAYRLGIETNTPDDGTEPYRFVHYGDPPPSQTTEAVVGYTEPISPYGADAPSWYHVMFPYTRYAHTVTSYRCHAPPLIDWRGRFTIKYRMSPNGAWDTVPINQAFTYPNFADLYNQLFTDTGWDATNSHFCLAGVCITEYRDLEAILQRSFGSGFLVFAGAPTMNYLDGLVVAFPAAWLWEPAAGTITLFRTQPIQTPTNAVCGVLKNDTQYRPIPDFVDATPVSLLNFRHRVGFQLISGKLTPTGAFTEMSLEQTRGDFFPQDSNRQFDFFDVVLLGTQLATNRDPDDSDPATPTNDYTISETQHANFTLRHFIRSRVNQPNNQHLFTQYQIRTTSTLWQTLPPQNTTSDQYRPSPDVSGYQYRTRYQITGNQLLDYAIHEYGQDTTRYTLNCQIVWRDGTKTKSVPYGTATSPPYRIKIDPLPFSSDPNDYRYDVAIRDNPIITKAIPPVLGSYFDLSGFEIPSSLGVGSHPVTLTAQFVPDNIHNTDTMTLVIEPPLVPSIQARWKNSPTTPHITREKHHFNTVLEVYQVMITPDSRDTGANNYRYKVSITDPSNNTTINTYTPSQLNQWIDAGAFVIAPTTQVGTYTLTFQAYHVDYPSQPSNTATLTITVEEAGTITPELRWSQSEGTGTVSVQRGQTRPYQVRFTTNKTSPPLTRYQYDVWYVDSANNTGTLVQNEQPTQLGDWYTLNWVVPNTIATGDGTLRIQARDRVSGYTSSTVSIPFTVQPQTPSLTMDLRWSDTNTTHPRNFRPNSTISLRFEWNQQNLTNIQHTVQLIDLERGTVYSLSHTPPLGVSTFSYTHTYGLGRFRIRWRITSDTLSDERTLDYTVGPTSIGLGSLPVQQFTLSSSQGRAKIHIGVYHLAYFGATHNRQQYLSDKPILIQLGGRMLGRRLQQGRGNTEYSIPILVILDTERDYD